MVRWIDLTPAEQADARSRLAAELLADDLVAGHAAEAPGDSLASRAEIVDVATDPDGIVTDRIRRAVAADPALRRLWNDMLQRAAVAVEPVRRAAAPADDTQRERSGPGFVMRLIDSRALPGQVFLVLELDADWQGPPPRSLTLSRPTPDGESDPAPERVALPAASDGRIRLVASRDEAWVAAFLSWTKSATLA